jgi:hypothetical protein
MIKTTHAATQAESDGLGDWRLQAATRTTADIPAAYPGGPSHKAGSPMYLVTVTEMAGHPNLQFLTPSASALALESAFRASERAATLWSQIGFDAVQTPRGPGTAIRFPATPALFDYFEECLTSAGASFQAIEAFANEIIARHLKGTLTLQRQKGPEDMTADAIQRTVRTEEKIATVIPTLLQKPSLKGRVEWQRFKQLKDVRDASIHFKSDDQYPPGGRTDKDSLYYLLLNNDPKQFPRIALAVIWKLRVEPEMPRWLAHLAEKYGQTG